MPIKRNLFAFLLLLLVAGYCFAAMTIYFKDGSSVQVHKIVFNGNQAELWLMNGTTSVVPVDKLDLPTSGIFNPVGTYGETTVGPSGRTGVGVARPIIPAARQQLLQEEWNNTDLSATATQNVGLIRKGDVVKIVNHTDARPRFKRYTYYDYETKTEVVTPDNAYVIIYKNPDGTFSKRLFDASTFMANFKIAGSPAQAPGQNQPVVPSVSNAPSPQPALQPPVPQEQQSTEPQPQESAKSSEESGGMKPAIPPQTESQSPASAPKKPALIWLISAAAIIIAVGAGVLLIKSRQKPFVDTSRFRHYEEELRDFEIEIWLKNGKTADQLMEICMKKFYQDNPAAMSIAAKMLKGSEKNYMIPFIIKQSGKQSQEAEAIYADIQRRIDFVRATIQQVSARTGLQPLVATATQPSPVVTQRTVVPTKVAPSVPSPAQPASSPSAASSNSPISEPFPLAEVVLSSPPSPPSRKDEISPVPHSHADLPDYALSVFNQLSFLCRSEEEAKFVDRPKG